MPQFTAAIVVLGRLTDAGELELVDLVVVIDVVQREREGRLQSRRRRHARAEGHIARERGIEALDLAAALQDLARHAEDIARPRLRGFVLFVKAELGIILQIDRVGADLVRPVGFDLGHHALVDGSREYEAAVIIGVLADKVDTSGRSVQLARAAEMLGEFLAN